MSLYSRFIKIVILFACLSTAISEAATYVRTRSGAGVRVRSASGKVIGSLPNGARLRIDPAKPSTGKFVYIIYNGKKGRVARSLTTSRNTEVPAKKRNKRLPEDTTDDSNEADIGNSSSNGTCGTVHANCRTHRITFTGSIRISARDSVIDCGYGGRTHGGVGRVGGPHPPAGAKKGDYIVPPGKGVRIEDVPRMGDAGGGKVFHVKWWDGLPTGENKSRGCIRISPAVLRALKKCRGAPLKITGSTGGSSHDETKKNLRKGVR